MKRHSGKQREESEAMICKACGATIPDGSEFCNRCGKKIAADPTAEKTPVEKLAASQDKADEAADAKERVLWEGRLSWKAYGIWFLLLVALAIAFLVYFILQLIKGNANVKWIGYAELIVWLGLDIYLTLKVLKLILSCKYRVTTQRLFIERGIISRTVDEIELVRVDDVTVHQGLFGRLFNVGDVTVVSTDASDAQLLMRGIEDPVGVKEKIREYTQKRRKKTLNIERV